MPGFEWSFNPDQDFKYPDLPGVTFIAPTAMTGFGANGRIVSGTGSAQFVITTGVKKGTYFKNDNDHDTTHRWSAEYPSKTDKDSNGNLTAWNRIDNDSSSTTQTLSYLKPVFETNQNNGFPHIKFVSGDHLLLDDTIALRSNQEWTIVIVTGPTTPSLFGCHLGSLNSAGSTILSSYRWAGTRLKLKNDSGDETSLQYSSSVASGYGGGSDSIHVIRCDGNNDVYLRLNGSDLGSDTVTSGSQYNFSRIAHLKTTSTQQNATWSCHEILVFDSMISGDDLTGLEGDLMSKYAITGNLISTHPHYNATASTSYSTPMTTSANDATNSALSLTTSLQNFSMKSTTLSANTEYVVFATDISGSPTIEIKASWT